MAVTIRSPKVFKCSVVRNALTVRAGVSVVPGTAESTSTLGTAPFTAPIKAGCIHCATELDVPVGSHTTFPCHFQCPVCGAVTESI